MSQNSLRGIDPKTGDIISLAAAITHPGKDRIRMTAAPGYDITVIWEMAKNKATVCIANGEDSFLFGADLAPNEEIVNVEQHDNYVEVTTRVR